MRTPMRTVTAAAIAGLALASVGVTAAHAEDGTASNGWGYTLYTDYNPDDWYEVCDQAADGMSAVGWIEVERDNGTWNKYATVKATGGSGSCASNNVDITRESARVRVVNCRQDISAGGPIQNCDKRIYSGS